MKTFYLWVTVPTPASEPGLITQLIHQGYVVSTLSCDNKTTHWDNSLCSIIALKLEKAVEPVGEKRAASVVVDDIMAAFKTLNATLLSIVVGESPHDSAWNIGVVPADAGKRVVPDDVVVSPLLREEPFG